MKNDVVIYGILNAHPQQQKSNQEKKKMNKKKIEWINKIEMKESIKGYWKEIKIGKRILLINLTTSGQAK